MRFQATVTFPDPENEKQAKTLKLKANVRNPILVLNHVRDKMFSARVRPLEFTVHVQELQCSPPAEPRIYFGPPDCRE